MADGVTVANAFVQIMPSMEGATDSISSAILPGVENAGSNAGAGFNEKFAGMLAKFAVPAAIIATLVEVGKIGFNAYEQVEEGANALITATGATGEAADELIDVYKQVASNVSGDFGDIGAAVGELNTRLGLTGDELEAASEAAMKYAKVNGVDATQAVQDVTRMMNNAGISADEYAHTLDLLTVAAQQSGVDVSKLATLVTDNAATFRELGFSTEESIAMLAQFEKGGVNTSAVLAGMKKGAAEWAKEGKSASEGYAEFVQGVQDGSISSADAIELFGSRSGIAMYDAAKNGQLSYDDMFASITEGSEGALDQVYNDTLTASEKMDIAMKNVTMAGAEIFAPIVEAFAGFLTDTVIPFAQQLRFYVQQAGQFIQDSGIADAVIQIAGTVQGVIDAVLPYIVAIVGTAIAAIEQRIQDVQTVVGIVTGVFEGVKSAIEGPINAARDIVGGAIEAIKGFFNFNITWPHIPMPHFAISPSGWQIGDLLQGSIPTLGIDWYAQGAVFTKPTVLAGVGEGGEPEGVFPLSYLDSLLDSGDGGTVYNLYIDGAQVNSSPEIQAIVFNTFADLRRAGLMNRG